MSEIEIQSPAYLRLSVQRSLIGNVTANLAGLRASLTERTIVIDAYFFAAPSDEDQELISEVATVVVADFPDGYVVEEYLHLLSEIKVNQATWHFLRREGCE